MAVAKYVDTGPYKKGGYSPTECVEDTQPEPDRQ